MDTEAVYGGLETALTWLPDPAETLPQLIEQHGEQKAFNYLAANFIRAFGKQDWYARWAEITLAELRRLGFNTVANWSDWQIASQSGTALCPPACLTSTRPFPWSTGISRMSSTPIFPRPRRAFAEPLRETA